MQTRLAWLLAVAVGVASLIVPAAVRAGGAPEETLSGVVNLNTASVLELELLPGVGPAKAKRIVEAREKRPFRNTWDVTRVRGIGPGFVKRHRAHLAVEGETTLRRVEPAADRKTGTRDKREP